MQLTPKIHFLKHQFKVEFNENNKIPCYANTIVIFGKGITLIDSGVKDSWKTIFNYIKIQGRKPEEIKKLILSHSHPEQIGSANKIKELTNCKVLAHIDEKEWFENIDKQYQQRPVPDFFEMVDKSVSIDQFIEHNQELELDDMINSKVFHRPGHSKGSINLYFLEDKILFTADSIPVKGNIPNYDNYLDLIDSLQRIKLQENKKILIGSTIEPIYGHYAIENMINVVEKYLKKLDTLVKINYTGGIEKILEHCSEVIKDIELPEYYIRPIVDRAFRTHLG